MIRYETYAYVWRITQKILYHLGFQKTVDHTSLSRASESRDYRIFEGLGIYLIGLVRPMYSKVKLSEITIDNVIYALDSTTISTNIRHAAWTLCKYSKVPSNICPKVSGLSAVHASDCYHDGYQEIILVDNDMALDAFTFLLPSMPLSERLSPQRTLLLSIIHTLASAF